MYSKNSIPRIAENTWWAFNTYLGNLSYSSLSGFTLDLWPNNSIVSLSPLLDDQKTVLFQFRPIRETLQAVKDWTADKQITDIEFRDNLKASDDNWCVLLFRMTSSLPEPSLYWAARDDKSAVLLTPLQQLSSDHYYGNNASTILQSTIS